MPLIQSVARADLPAVAALLDSADADCRRDAVQCADVHADAAALLARIDVENDTGIRALIVHRLVASRDPHLVRPLLGYVRSDDIMLRNTVSAALPAMGEVLLPDIARLCADEDPAVRLVAVSLLQGLHSPRAVDLALATLATEPHVNVCAAIVDMLAEAGGPEAVAPLEALVRRFPDAPFIAFAVAVAIKRIG
jgi:HEAT repeat protein